VVFSSHVLAEVEQVCDRVGILRQGRLVHLQDMAELREGRRVTGRFRRPVTGPDGLPGLTVCAARPDGTAELEYRGPLPPLLDWLKAHDPEELRVEPLGLSGIYHRYHGAAA
jgi:ABC-2 type transport system ATP-binding protein